MTIEQHCIFETGYGWMGLAGSHAGISRVILPQLSADKVLDLLNAREDQIDKDAFGDLPLRLQQYFEGNVVDFSDELDLSGATGFQINVWLATQAIPNGQTQSYGWIADSIGKPNAARAVGQALKANPIPILIPCHRVVSGNGGLGGYRGGIDMKQTLLSIENSNRL
ncbi:methylated-DNA--[protein]-cysteine S-methyltransferase [Chloroflexota bacterium]